MQRSGLRIQILKLGFPKFAVEARIPDRAFSPFQSLQIRRSTFSNNVYFPDARILGSENFERVSREYPDEYYSMFELPIDDVFAAQKRGSLFLSTLTWSSVWSGNG